MAEYIEREALIDKTSDIFKNGNRYRVIFFDDVILAPAADVAPMAHAHWVEKIIPDEVPDWDCVCSICEGGGLPSYNYCPNCGAKMDEEENDT